MKKRYAQAYEEYKLAKLHQNYFVNPTSQDQGFQGIDECHGYPSGMQPMNKLEEVDQLDCSQFDFTQDFNHNFYIDFNDNVQFEEDRIPQISGMRPSVLPPSAFLGPKCALWDCPRPAQVSEFSQDYCSDYHGGLALTEGPPGMSPILRPGGIDLKDGPLFAALSAKILGKDVGIPECEGAATTKSPWNAPGKLPFFALCNLCSGA
ncbi:hypothetical protein GIB67_015650 [Kingdonia uniflora]|uniref:Uncharacterized protein n=1 Tax=Kingdonia uniflora TaxID=39325 RepID=A0A7J7NUW4_9MAGN|nr:hypothetical protein GIB67_015650 [Kingdonia uniflora]